MACFRFLVSGRVQGVGFRQSTRHRCQTLGLTGWVRNRSDGKVEGEAQGGDAALNALHRWLSEGGPPMARVDALDWTAATGATHSGAFEIRS